MHFDALDAYKPNNLILRRINVIIFQSLFYLSGWFKLPFEITNVINDQMTP